MFSYFSTDRHYFRNIFRSLDSKDEREKQVYISRLIIDYAKNFVLSPKLWDVVLKKDQSKISSLYIKLDLSKIPIFSIYPYSESIKLTHEGDKLLKKLNFFRSLPN